MSLQQRDSKVVWHPFTQACTELAPCVIERAQDAVLYSKDRAYIDAIASWWLTLHGHCHPHIVERIAEQAGKLDQVIFAGATHEPAITLAERLSALLPEGLERMFYSDNGSTAVEVALKMALQFWYNRGEERRTIVSLDGGYHGDTFGAMSVGSRGFFNKPFEPLLFRTESISPPFFKSSEQALSDLERLIAGGDVAAFVYEPLVQGAGGMRMYDAAGLEEMLRLCRHAGVLTIADEVMTGFGRTGSLFASEQCQTKPDLLCLSKALTGGTLPLSVTAASEAVFGAFFSEAKEKMFLHGHSFTANPIACAAANASLDLVESPAFSADISRISSLHRNALKTFEAHEMVESVRTKGVILALTVKNRDESSYSNPLSDKLRSYFMASGVFLRPLGNVIYVLPPHCISDEQLSEVYGVIAAALDEQICR